MMGDMGDLYREWDECKRVAKESRLAIANQRRDELLNLAPVRIRTKHHWTITLCNQPDIQFWPSTGKWMHQNKQYHGTFDDLLGFIRNREAA